MLYVRIVFNHRPAHIISLNASAGQFPIGRKTFWLAGRLMRSFVTIYRKTQDSAYRRLHEHPGGPTEGIRVNFLGQNDASLPLIPPDPVTREAVRDYPIDFAPMRQVDIALLCDRGEQLPPLLVSRYLPGLQRPRLGSHYQRVWTFPDKDEIWERNTETSGLSR